MSTLVSFLMQHVYSLDQVKLLAPKKFREVKANGSLTQSEMAEKMEKKQG